MNCQIKLKQKYLKLGYGGIILCYIIDRLKYYNLIESKL